MKNLIKFSVLSVIFCAFSFTIQDKPDKIVKLKEFEKHIDSLGINFKMPKGYKEVATKQNKDLFYIFAIKNEKEDFEVRYSIQPIAEKELKKYQECEKDPNCHSLDPNFYYKSWAMANISNMTGLKKHGYGKFPEASVRKEFNADAGLTQFFEVDSQFGKGYKYGQMVVLHKDNVADVIITYLSNNKEKHSSLMHTPFYSLTFK